MIANGVSFGRCEAFAFDGANVQKLRALEFCHDIQGVDQLRQVVSVQRADIVPTQLLKHGARRYHALHVFLGLLGEIPGASHMLENFLGALAQRGVGLTGPDLGKVGRQTSCIMADRHLVIVQDDQHIGAFMTGMRQCLKGHTAGNGTVADYGDDLAINALILGGKCHTHRSRNAGRGVANTEGVIGALGALWKPGQALELSHAVHAIAPASQNLVRIGLVPDVPDNAIVRGVEHVVKCHCQLHHAQPRTEVPTGACDRIQQVMT